MAKPKNAQTDETPEAEVADATEQAPSTLPPDIAAHVTGDGGVVPNPVVVQAPEFDTVRRVGGHLGNLRPVADTTVSAEALGPYRDSEHLLSRSEVAAFCERAVFMGGDPLRPIPFKPQFVQHVQVRQRGWLLVTTEGIHFGIKDPAEFVTARVA